MTFEKFIVKTGNIFDLTQGGIFTTHVSGIYEFAFSGYSKSGIAACGIEVYKNENDNIHGFFMRNDYGLVKLESSWIVSLNDGDTINLKVMYGRLFSDSYRYRILTGKLLEITS